MNKLLSSKLLITILICIVNWLAFASAFKVLKIHEIECVIIPPDYVNQHKILFNSGEFDGVWTPSVKDIEKVNSLLAEYFQKLGHQELSAKQVEYLKGNYAKSRCQYVGLITKAGRFIHVNAIPLAPARGTDMHENWINSFVVYYDGGADYWQINYHVDEGVFKDLTVNQDP
jgi:hypothetical protein